MVFENRDTSCEPLYSKVQRFYLRNNLSDEKHKDLRITVNFTNSHSKVSKQVLSIQVSDDDDPFFFYSLVLTDDDYQRLKQLQGLLVDFESFPSQVIRLLEQCKENENRDTKFLLLLEDEKSSGSGDMSKTSLKIVETNNFKHLCHLTLNIMPGNDSDIKKLMMQKIKVLKDQNQRAEKCISELESQLFSKSKLLSSKEGELKEIQLKCHEERLAFKAESCKELTEETEKLRKAQLEWQIKSQRERNELEDKYQTNLKEKDAQLSHLQLENQILQEKRSHCDMTISEQARRIEALEKEVSNLRAESMSLKKQNSKLDTDYHEKDKAVNSLRTRLAVAEQEGKDMAILMKKQQELINSTNEQKLRLEDVISEKDRSIQRKQTTIQNLTDELVKANEIITKIQKDLSVVNQKLKVRTVIALEQEKVVEDSQAKIKLLEETLSLQEKKIKSLLDSEHSLKSSVAELNNSIEFKDKKIKDNERLIDWLNRRLTEQSKSSSPNGGSVKNGYLMTGVTSTPFPHVKGHEINSGAPLLYSAIGTTPVDSVRTLDQVKNNQVEDENSSSALNVKAPSESSQEDSKHQLTPKTSISSGNKKTSGAKNIHKKTSFKTPGFKRTTLPEVQVGTLPSSYFLK